MNLDVAGVPEPSIFVLAPSIRRAARIERSSITMRRNSNCIEPWAGPFDCNPTKTPPQRRRLLTDSRSLRCPRDDANQVDR